jgi:uncharacterized membrane protein
MKFKEIMSKILSNKLVLNITLVLAILNIIGLIVMNDFTTVVYFILFALLMTYLSKNMIIVLGLPLIIINLFNLNRKEGMENNDSDEKDAAKEQAKKRAQSKGKEIKTDMTMEEDNNDESTSNESTSNESTNNEPTSDESFEVGRTKKGGYNIDYAATVESAYDDLNKILGGDGIKSLTDDTQKLMKQQLQLTESMKSMEPFIKNMAPMLQQAQGILGSMNNKENGLGNIMEMAKKMSGGK